MTRTLKRRLSEIDVTETLTTTTTETNVESTTEILQNEQPEKIFGNMRLKRILKENHGHDIEELAFCFSDKTTNETKEVDPDEPYSIYEDLNVDHLDASNVLGTVGGAQINVYDNEHFGSHLDIMSNFNLAGDVTQEQEYEEKVLNSFCWIHQKDNALVAAGGIDGDVHILSIAHSKEIAVLKGHTKPITDIKAYPQNNNYVLSISKDGTMRLWNVEKQICVVTYEYDGYVGCFNPASNTFITGNTKGELREWEIPTTVGSKDETAQIISKKKSRILKKMHGDATIDCIRYANGNVLSKSINGRMEYWNPLTELTIQSFRVKTGENYSRFDVSLDGAFFCVGTNNGSIFIYNLKTGKMVTELTHRRSTKPIRSCVFTRDCRQVLCGGISGFLWRYDYIDDATLDKWDAWTK